MFRKTNEKKSDHQDTVWCRWHVKPAWTGSYFEYENFKERCSKCSDCFVGIIDKKGKFIIEPGYKSIRAIKPGLYKVGKGDCTSDPGEVCYYGVVNEKNEDLLQCNFKFSDIIRATEDQRFWIVQDGFDEYAPKGIIDRACNTIVPIKYHHLDFGPVIDEKNPITVGLETSRKGEEGEMKLSYVFIDLKQERVMASSFDYASSFFKGIAEVSKNREAYCIKSDGTLLEYCTDCSCYR